LTQKLIEKNGCGEIVKKKNKSIKKTIQNKINSNSKTEQYI
jgi:hypothetical protein